MKLQTYLAPSKVCNGIGVFALDYIPKNSAIFSSPRVITKYSWHDVNKSAHEKIKSLTHNDSEGFWIDCEPDRIYGAYYINHGEDPNVIYSKTGTWYAMRDIVKDEEILSNYSLEERDWLT